MEHVPFQHHWLSGVAIRSTLNQWEVLGAFLKKARHLRRYRGVTCGTPLRSA